MTARTAVLTALALVAFAANSLLCRAALGPRLLDAASFTSIRLGAGAAVLAALVLARSRGAARSGAGSWASAAALFAYAIAFSLSYRLIPAGVGALVLFGCVQATMIGRGLFRGDGLHRREAAGLALSIAGLVVLARPGLTAPDPVGVLLMALAGIAWGVYSLRGRGVARPLEATADNFVRSVPMVLAALATAFALSAPHATARGALLAATSGALTSGLGYVVWYAALPALEPKQAAIVQLAVPLLAAAGGVTLLGEVLTVRFLAATPLILGGIALALIQKRS